MSTEIIHTFEPFYADDSAEADPWRYVWDADAGEGYLERVKTGTRQPLHQDMHDKVYVVRSREELVEIVRARHR